MIGVSFTSLARELFLANKFALLPESLHVMSCAVQSSTISGEIGGVDLTFAIRAFCTTLVVLMTIKDKLGVIGVDRLCAHSALVGVVHGSTEGLEAILDTCSFFAQSCTSNTFSIKI
jgi:hypothetical protein